MELKLKSSVLFIALYSSTLFAGADYSRPVCNSLYKNLGFEVATITDAQKSQALKTLNEKMSLKHPDLKIILDDPDEFFAIMERRFEAQKKLTPNDPYRFDFTEISMPLFNKMHKGVRDRILELKSIREKLVTGEASSSVRKKYPMDQLDTNLKYLEDLEKEIYSNIKSGKITYKDSVEISAFYGPAMGHFNTAEMSLRDRTMLRYDRYLEGHVERPIEVEYEAFLKRDFHLFQKGQVAGSSGYARIQKQYEDAFHDKQKLQTLIVPNDDELDCDIFMRLMSREKINIVGVTAKPIKADGFLRPSADFFVHDARHESAKFFEKKEYLRLNSIKEKDEIKVNLQMDHWYISMEDEIQKIKDPDLRKAVDLLVFNYYHDRGFPVVPSSIFTGGLDNVQFGLLALLKISKTGVDFKSPVVNLKKAEFWLKDYWEKRLPEEQKFLQGLKD